MYRVYNLHFFFCIYFASMAVTQTATGGNTTHIIVRSSQCIPKPMVYSTAVGSRFPIFMPGDIVGHRMRLFLYVCVCAFGCRMSVAQLCVIVSYVHCVCCCGGICLHCCGKNYVGLWNVNGVPCGSNGFHFFFRYFPLRLCFHVHFSPTPSELLRKNHTT